MNHDIIRAEQALSAALAAAQVESARLCGQQTVRDAGYWAVTFETEYTRYTCYVDAESGEVPGLLSEPLSVEEQLAKLKDEQTRRPTRDGAFSSVCNALRRRRPPARIGITARSPAA